MSDEAAYKREIVASGGMAEMYRPPASVRSKTQRVTASSLESRDFSQDSLLKARDEGQSRTKRSR